MKYEKSHPTVTIRVSSELYGELQEMRSAAGFSYAEVFRAGLDKADLAVETELEGARKEGYRNGYAKGCDITKAKYSVNYHCARCRRKHLTITHDNEKASAARLMFEAGWHSPECAST